MADIYNEMDEQYTLLLDYIQDDEFWDEYLSDYESDYILPFDLEILIDAIDEARKIDYRIRITNLQDLEYKDIILDEYSRLYRSQMSTML